MVEKFAYYPGCSLHSSAKEYDLSTKAVCWELDIDLIEISDWNCCGASSARTTNLLLDLALNTRNLTRASEIGLDMLVPCSACFKRLAQCRETLVADAGLLDNVAHIIGKPLNLTSKAKHLMEVLVTDQTIEKLQRVAVKSLSGLRIAAYYGCLLTQPPRPSNVDNFENPSDMDRLVTSIGGEPVPWPYKNECCGASLSLTGEQVSYHLIERILEMARDCAVDCIITACPLCQANLDLGQAQITKETDTNYHIPILYFTQLIGLVLGLENNKLGLNRNFIDPRPVLQKVGLV